MASTEEEDVSECARKDERKERRTMSLSLKLEKVLEEDLGLVESQSLDAFRKGLVDK